MTNRGAVQAALQQLETLQEQHIDNLSRIGEELREGAHESASIRDILEVERGGAEGEVT